MTLSRKDVAATGLTALAVLTYLATHNSWGVWLIGGSHRWAAAAILVLGLATCSLGSMTKGFARTIPAVLGILALGLAVIALATGSLTPLSLLVVDIVVLWAVSTARHLGHAPNKHVVA